LDQSGRREEIHQSLTNEVELLLKDHLLPKGAGQELAASGKQQFEETIAEID
jgi:hypothetical protein